MKLEDTSHDTSFIFSFPDCSSGSLQRYGGAFIAATGTARR
jgi:hypothetical protein